LARKTRKSQSKQGHLLEPISNQIRIDILRMLNQEPASASDLAPRLREPVSNVSYHFKVLRNAGSIEAVRTERCRGALKTTYRATVPAQYTTEEWADLPQPVREEISQMMLRVVFSEVDGAVSARTFDSSPQRHLSWVPFPIDDEGSRELGGVLDEALDKVTRIKRESAERLTASGEEGTPIITAFLGFERAVAARR
jgi:DNA-binding transcriptional ArsR family regulator